MKEDGHQPRKRLPLKPHQHKQQLREKCLKRAREDRNHLLWKMRLSPAADNSPSLNTNTNHQKEVMDSTLRDIVSDELKKMKDSSFNDYLENQEISTTAAKAGDALREYDGPCMDCHSTETESEEIMIEMQRILYEVRAEQSTKVGDALWEYDGLCMDSQSTESESEEIMIEMQKIFYEDLRSEESRTEQEDYVETWEEEDIAAQEYEEAWKEDDSQEDYVETWEEEDIAEQDYEDSWKEDDGNLALAGLLHMRLDVDQVYKNAVWCPICKKGELQENPNLILCSRCKFKLNNKANEVNLEDLRVRLRQAYVEHLDRGCRMTPTFCTGTRVDRTALYMQCQACDTFEFLI